MNRFKYLLVGAIFLHLLSLWFDVGSSFQLAIAPLALGALAAAGGAALNDITNQINKSNAQYSVDLQKQLMDYSWNKYNSPKAQAKAYSDAGFNPAVAFGQGGMSAPIAPNVKTPDLAQGQVGISSDSLSNAILALTQSENTSEDTKAKQLGNQLFADTYKEQVEAIGLQNKWTQEQTSKISQEIGLMVGQFNECQQRIENLKSEQQLTDKSVAWFDRHMSAEIQHITASAEYQSALKGLTESQKQLLDDTLEDLKRLTTYQADQMQKIVGLLDKYGDAQAIVGMLSQVVGSASDLIGTITNFKNAGKVVETITGSNTQKSDGSWTTTNSRTIKR